MISEMFEINNIFFYKMNYMTSYENDMQLKFLNKN